MAFNKDIHPAAPSTLLRFQTFHWENGDGAQYFSANPITIDNDHISLVTMQQLEMDEPVQSENVILTQQIESA